MNRSCSLGVPYYILESMTHEELNTRLAEIAFHNGNADVNYVFERERKTILRILRERGFR